MSAHKLDSWANIFFWLVCALLLLVPIGLGSVFVSSDLGLFYLPLYKIFSHSIQTGLGIPFWCHDIFNGFYLHAEGQLGMLHPLQWLIFRIFPFVWAYDLTRVLPFVFAYVGMRVFCGAHSKLIPVRNMLSVVFAFNPFFLNHFVHTNMVFSLAHLPLLLYFSHGVAGTASGLRNILVCAILLGSVFLIGHPQSALLMCGICLLHSVLLVREKLLGHFAGMLAACVIALGIGAVQILPTVDLYLHSARQEITSGFATSWSLHPGNLAQILFPFVFNNFYLEYGTFLPVLLLAGSIIYFKEKSLSEMGRFRIFLVTLFLAGLAMAMGKYFYLDWLVSHVPFFRVPARYYFCSVFAVVLAAGFGYSKIVEAGRIEDLYRSYRYLFVVGILLSIMLLLADKLFNLAPLTTYWWISLFAFIPLLVPARAHPSLFLGICLIVASIEMVAYASHTRNFLVQKIDTYVASSPISKLAAVGASIGEKVATTDNRATLLGFRMSSGYVGLAPMTNKEKSHSHPGINWKFSPKKGWESVRKDISVAWLKADSGILVPISSTSFMVEHKTNNKLGFVTDFHKDSLIVLDVSYYSGWKAGIDKIKILPVQDHNGLIAFIAPPGRHNIELRFVPDSLRLGAVISGLFVFISFVAFLFCRGSSPITARSAKI